MKHFFYLFIMLNVNSFLCAQDKSSYVNNYVKLDTVLFFVNEEMIDNSSVHCMWNNILVFTNYNKFKKTDTVNVYFYNTQNKEIKCKSLFYSGLNVWFEDNQSISFSTLAFNDTFLVLGVTNQVFVYKKENNEFIFDKIIKINKSISYASFLNDKLLFFYSLKNNQQPQTSLWIYDIESGKIIKEINPDFQHPLFAYFQPKHLIDVKNGEILFSHQRDYASIIFNSNLDSVNHIKAKHIDWIRMKEKYINRINRTYPKEEAMNIIEDVEKLFPSIYQQRWTYFINQNKIICVYQTPYRKNEIPISIIDIWEKINGKFILTKQGIVDFLGIRPSNDTINNHSFGLEFLSGHQYIFTENNIIVFRKYTAPINPLDFSMSDFREQTNNYFSENNPITIIYIYSHSF